MTIPSSGASFPKARNLTMYYGALYHLPDGTVAACTGATYDGKDVWLYFAYGLPAYRERDLKPANRAFNQRD